MSLLPDVVRSEPALTPAQTQAAVRAQQRAELTIFRYALGAFGQAECDCIDSQATEEAFRAAMEHEVELLKYGLSIVDGSPAAAEIVARRVQGYVSANSRRLSRRFGG